MLILLITLLVLIKNFFLRSLISLVCFFIIVFELRDEARDNDAWWALLVFAPVITGPSKAVPGAAQLVKETRNTKIKNFLKFKNIKIAITRFFRKRIFFFKKNKIKFHAQIVFQKKT